MLTPPVGPDPVRVLFELDAAGRYDELLRRGTRLLAAHPDDVRLLSLLGHAALETGDAAAAVAHHRRALALRPGFAKGHSALGVAYLREGRLQAAYASFRRALELDPELAPAHFNLGILLENAGEPARAAAHYQRAVAQRPAHAPGWTALGGVRRELGDGPGALAALERALAVARDHVPAHALLLETLEQTGDAAGLAAALARTGAALGDGHPLVVLYRGIAAHRAGDRASARTLLEAARVPAADRAGRHHEVQRLARLVRVCDELDDTAAAVAFADAANDLSRRQARAAGVDKRTFLTFVAHRRALVDGGMTPAAAAGTTPAPVFVVGFPRSGTTLLDTLLRGHPGLDVVEESAAVAAMVTVLAGPRDERLDAVAHLPTLQAARLRQVYRRALAEHREPPRGVGLLVDRFALNMVYAGEIRQVFPRARFVLMLRDPADCVLSCYLRSFRPSPANANFFSLADAANAYHRVFDLWSRYREALGLEVVTVRYEDLVTDAGAAVSRILAALGVPWDDGVLDHQRTALARSAIRTASYDQVTRPVYREARGRWHRYRDVMAPVMPVLAPWRSRFGYGG